MPTVGSSITRERIDKIEQDLHEKTLNMKTKMEIKVREGQSLKVESLKNPELPKEAPDTYKKALRLLIERGATSVDALAPLLELTQANTLYIMQKLVAEDKVVDVIDKDTVKYLPKQTAEQVDSPYKGKKLKWANKCVHSVTPREDGKEDVTCTWDYELVDVH